MKLPYLRPTEQTRLTTAVFPGYDRRPVPPDGAMADTLNLTLGRFPLLASRPPRGVLRTLSAPGGLLAKDALCWVDEGTLYVNGLATALTGLAPGEKQLVGMGATLVVFPDKQYYNTADPSDFGSLEASYESAGDVVYTLCRFDGTPYERVAVGEAEPDDTSLELWISTAGGTREAMSYSAAFGGWVEAGTVYTRLSFTSQGRIPALFSEGDGVTVAGSLFEQANGEKILQAVGGSGESGAEENDFIVVVGLLENAFTQSEGSVTIARRVPELDFVCEAGNRLWGCFYGESGGEVLNELYACALGDFKNWRQYRGLSTDSWAASVGSDGPWTGAANYLGCPCFFKEDRIVQIGVSAVGAHALRETVCRGVQRGSHKSLAVVNDTLFYKSRAGVCAWQGGFPQGVSEALGDTPCFDAVGGALGALYVLSMRDGAGNWHLFDFDTEKGLWIREDGLHALQFAALEGELYALDADTGALLALRGTAGTPEESVSWEAVSPPLAVELPERKTLRRFNLRFRLAPGASAAVYLEYDGSGVWVESGTVTQTGLGTALLPVRPRRCDHLRMKIAGTGGMELLSITRVVDLGSDVVGTRP